MKKTTAILTIVIIVIVLVASGAAFTVKESEQVVLVRFGEVVRVITEPGLHFKIPIIQEVKPLDKRWLEWDGDANQITTRDKRYIYIDVFARWRISDPLVFIETLRDEHSAQGRLDDIIDNATRNVIANHNLIEAIRTTNRQFSEGDEESILISGQGSDQSSGAPIDPTAEQLDAQKAAAVPATSPEPSQPGEDGAREGKAGDQAAELPATATKKPQPARNSQNRISNQLTYRVQKGREKLTRLILKKASAKTAQLGIELKDVQIKRINYIESVQTKVFDRMISERKRVAEAFRSVGQGRYAEILGRMEKELLSIRSEAYRQSQEIKGKADAEAASVYAEAYRKNPEFYSFLKTMESYELTVDESSWLLMTTDSDYARNLRSMKGNTN